MEGDKGFKDEIAKLKGIKLATAPQDGQYATAPSLNITKTLIESGLKFNVAIGGCQEITDGIVQALKEENVPRDAVTVVTVNGGPMDINNFNKGNLDFALSQSPGLHGMINAVNLMSYLNKQPYQTRTYTPVVWVSKKDWHSKYITWSVDESWLPLVYDFVKTGEVQTGDAQVAFAPNRKSQGARKDLRAPLFSPAAALPEEKSGGIKHPCR